LSNTDLSKKDILEAVRRQLLDQLADNDFFNIFISETDITPLHETWLPADEATINAFFAAIDSDDLSSFSNLPNLLEKGIAYIQAQGNDGELLLVSNASQIEEIESANTFIAEIRADLINNEIPIHVSDYQDRGGYHYSVNGVSYFGNEYFYNRLTRLTSGELSTIRENEYNLTTTITTSFARIFDLEGILDLHTTLEDGFCYARYDLPDPIGSKSISRPLVQIGKYSGTFPFLIEASGETKGQLFGEKLVIPAEQIQQAPPMSQTIWAGNYIQELEREPTTNSIIREIIDWSINHRVLSYFTAFLALEVEQGGEVCENCIDETDLSTATSEVLADSLVQITASPNPFSEQTTITVQLGNQMDVNSTNFSIYDTNGRAIRTFTSTTNSENRYQFNWDGTDTNGQPLSKGMYLFNVRTEQGMKNLKLIYLK